MNNDTVSTSTVYAAGGVLWRVTGGRLRVLVVHRTTHDDISFPKGKVKAGEILAETAAREVREETGIAAPLGPPIGDTRYALPNGRDKIVHYWAMRAKDRAVRESTFAPNREVSAVEWLTAEKALKRLTYEFDVDILEQFLAQFENGARATFPVVALRHGAAMSRKDWPRADHLRPLLPKGRDQAKALAGEHRHEVPADRASAVEGAGTPHRRDRCHQSGRLGGRARRRAQRRFRAPRRRQGSGAVQPRARAAGDPRAALARDGCAQSVAGRHALGDVDRIVHRGAHQQARTGTEHRRRRGTFASRLTCTPHPDLRGCGAAA